MATEQFTSTDEINQHYERQIKTAGDDELAVANLRAERGERLAEFTQQQARRAEHRSWVTEAARKHDIPDELVDMIERFDSQEEIDKAAERLASVRKAPVQTAQDLYGGSTSGGGTPIQTSKDPDAEFLTKFEEDWNNHEQRSQRDYQRYIEIKMGRHVYGAMKRVGKKHIWDRHPAAESIFERF